MPPAEECYSFQFDGRLQTLDHVLVTEALLPRVADFRYAHIGNDYHRRPPHDGHAVSDHDPAVRTLDARYDFSGFDGLAAPPASNTVKSGKAVELRFSLDGAGGPEPLAGTPVSQVISCSTGAAVGPEEPLVGDLRREGDLYVVTWQTPSRDGRECRVRRSRARRRHRAPRPLPPAVGARTAVSPRP